MTFQVPESKRSIKQNQFLFQVPDDGREYSIPKAQFLPVGVIEKMAGNPEEVTILDILGMFDTADEAATKAIRTLDATQLQALTQAWQDASGVTTGESSASTSS